jgi:hypothetical protein
MNVCYSLSHGDKAALAEVFIAKKQRERPELQQVQI